MPLAARPGSGQPLAAVTGEFPCAHGCTWSGEPFAGAWAVLAHQAAAQSVRRLAVAARAGDEAAGDAAVDTLTRYAELYRRLAGSPHPAAQPWMLSGRLFQQALTEAIWTTSLAHAVQTVAGRVPDSVAPERLAPAAELLRTLRAAAAQARDRLVERGDFRNNYTAWLNAAGASTSRALALLGEPDRLAEWVGGPHGVAAHAEAAVYPDGWEWEASSYYHVFVLRGYLLALRGCPPPTWPAGLRSRVDAMIAVVAALHTERGGTLPALHDTPYAGTRWDDELYELCLLGAQLPDAPSLAGLASPLAARLPDAGWRAAETRGWFGVAEAACVPPERGSRLFADAGYAVLAGDGYRAVLDFGPHGGSHGHLDKLALYLYGPTAAWQPDYGVPPYAHRLRREYYARTAAHPTLTVDGLDQAEATGRLLAWVTATGPATVVGAAADVYPGVRFTRWLRASADLLVDVVIAEADRDRDFELHLRADVDVQVRRTSDGFQTRWSGDGGLLGLHVAVPDRPLETVPDLGPADDPQRSRPHPRWRISGRRAVFASAYSPGDAVVRLDLGDSGPAPVVVAHRPDGTAVRWPVGDRA